MTLNAADEPGGFAELALRPELLRALSGLGYEEPTPIQREAIPPVLQGRDLLGQAASGTGKTAAFALPMLQRISRAGGDGAPRAVVLVPTRELAVQVSEAVHRYGRDLGTDVLDMGFADDIEAILQDTPSDRQTVLFSATLPPRIDAIARRHLREPVRIQIGRESPVRGRAPLVRQSAYVVPRSFKTAALGRVLDVESPAAAIVFCRTREEVDQVAEALNGRGYRAEALHGGMGQDQRDRVMGRLRGGTADLLVATDVAARGLDIEQLTHVVNYNVPSSPDSYVHRIGRVGRAGREGVAITLVEPREHRMLQTIERVTRQRITVEKVPTVADLRARRLELTRAALDDSLLQDNLESFRVVVETLTDEFDVMDVAMAAVKLAHEASGAAAEEEIPQLEVPAGRERRGCRAGVAREERHGRAPAEGMPRVFVGAGRTSGIRPQDLVGAITGESNLSGREIGSIEIADRFSLIEVPESAADTVIRTCAVRPSKVGRRPYAGSANGRGDHGVPRATGRPRGPVLTRAMTTACRRDWGVRRRVAAVMDIRCRKGGPRERGSIGR